MKKLLTLSLVVFMLAAMFASCGDTTTDNPVVTTTEPAGDDTTVPEGDGFIEINETVYVNEKALNGLNVRSTPNRTSADEESNVIGSLVFKQSVIRIGINETTGWSKIEYNGGIGYVSSEYLSTTEPGDVETTLPFEADEVPEDSFITFESPVNTVIYPTRWDAENSKDVHVEGSSVSCYSVAIANYSSADNAAGKYDSYKVLSLDDGAEIQVSAVFYEKEDDRTYGWCEFTYEGETYYVRNSQVKFIVAPDAE